MTNQINTNAEKQSFVKRTVNFLTFGIWSLSLSELPKGMAKLVSFLRVISTTFSGVSKNNIPSQASALSYTSLLALGPLIALIILTSSVFFRDKGEKLIYEQIINTIEFTMPAISEIAQTKVQQGVQNGEKAINPQVMEFIDNISKSSASLGMFGTIATIVTCLLLCVTMENSFNKIWGVKIGRKWINRIVFYWALISLGSAFGIFGMTFLASSQLSKFFANVPYFEYFESGGTYLIGFSALTLLFTFVYKFLPFTYVRWVPALCGGLVATLALILNNKMSFIYISTIVKNQNFYGYLAILPIALFSLYVFWLFVLTGAQISYAVQNIDWLSSKFMWEKVSMRSRNLICLAVFAKISNCFYKVIKAPSIKDLGKDLNIPKPIVRSCVNTLLAKSMICATKDINIDNQDQVYKPAIEPDSITLAQFFFALDTDKSDDSLKDDLSKDEPIIEKAILSYKDYEQTEYASKSIKELLS